MTLSHIFCHNAYYAASFDNNSSAYRYQDHIVKHVTDVAAFNRLSVLDLHLIMVPLKCFYLVCITRGPWDMLDFVIKVEKDLPKPTRG